MAVSSILKHSSRENQKDRSGSDLRSAFKHVKIEWVHEFRISKYERSRRDEDAIIITHSLVHNDPLHGVNQK